MRMLRAGIMEDGLTKASEEGAPQGAIVSPLLSNIYLHYVLDLWFEKRVKLHTKGEAYLLRQMLEAIKWPEAIIKVDLCPFRR